MTNVTPKQECFCLEIVRGQKFSNAYRVAYEPKKMVPKVPNNQWLKRDVKEPQGAIWGNGCISRIGFLDPVQNNEWLCE